MLKFLQMKWKHIFISEYIFNYIIPLGNKIEIFIYFFFLFCLSQTFVLFFHV